MVTTTNKTWGKMDTLGQDGHFDVHLAPLTPLPLKSLTFVNRQHNTVSKNTVKRLDDLTTVLYG
jgi:hypothetical protein